MSPSNKIKSIQQVTALSLKAKRLGKIIVTTNGTFDIVHTAHLRLLQKAKMMGNLLIVLINSDASVKKLKGEQRPILPERERLIHLSFLEMVDYVVVFDEDTPLKILQKIKPDFHIKGGSFIKERIMEEKKLVANWGGKFKTFELENGYSTTNIIETIIERYKDK